MSVDKTIRHVKALATGIKYLVSSKRMTLMYPDEIEEFPDGYRGMIKYNWDTCIKCGLCAMVCPADAMKMYISKEESEEGKKPVRRPGINYARCVFCGFCVAICPTNSLKFTKVHDVVYNTLEEQVYPPEKFREGVPKPQYKKKPKKMRAILDEERGLRYEPVE